MSRVSEVRKLFQRNSATVHGCGCEPPFSIALPEADLEFLFRELDSRAANVTALQKKLNASKNMHKQKDDMIARRDRSIKKAHDYIETLKAKLRERSAVGQTADEA